MGGSASTLREALFAGELSLMAEPTYDGAPCFVLYRNPTLAVPHRALTATERRVVELNLKGLSGKQTAYELGISSANSASCLSLASAKLGLRSATDLACAFAQLNWVEPREAPRAANPLSPSERVVLGYLKQGMTNAEIAALRGTSERTVAHQVSALLRKTGAANRRAACLLM